MGIQHHTKAPAKQAVSQKLSGDQTLILANELRDYAHDLLAIHVVADYDYQMGKWQRHINLVVDAQNEAHKRHKKILEDIAASDAFAMLALSFVAGPMLSWVSGAVQYNLYPRYAKTLSQRMGAKGTEVKGDPSKVAAKIFGDTAASTVQLGTDRLFQLAAVDPARRVNLAAATSGSIASFKTTLENALIEEGDLRKKAIRDLAMRIRKDPNYGEDVLKKMYRIVPNSETQPYHAQEAAAKGMIRAGIDCTRIGWACDWLYYGNDPAPEAIDVMSNKMECEIWALWILDQKFRMLERKPWDPAPVTFPVGEDIALREEIVKRLVDLDIVLAQPKEIPRAWPLPSAGPTEESMKQVKEQLARRKNDVSLSIPVLREGDIDTKEEVRALNEWAAHHPPALLGGKKSHVPRILPPVEKIHV